VTAGTEARPATTPLVRRDATRSPLGGYPGRARHPTLASKLVRREGMEPTIVTPGQEPDAGGSMRLGLRPLRRCRT
jgi:hypothetical protein